MKTDLLGNLIGLDYTAVKAVIELYQIPAHRQKWIFNQVLKCHHWAVEVMKQTKPTESN